MKKLCYLLALALSVLAFSACTGGYYTITGTLPEEFSTSDSVSLRTLSDSCILSVPVSNGKYTFKAQAPAKPCVCFVGVYDMPVAFVYLEPGKIKVEESVGEGTPMNDELSEWMSAINRSSTLDSLAADFKARLEKHGADYLGASMLYMYASAFSANDLCDFLDLCSDEIRESDIVAPVISHVEKVAQTSVGKPFTDVTMAQPDGTLAHLSEYIGKGDYVLVDFWASWCVPCRRSIPDVKAAYQTYSRKGLKVLGVAVNDDPSATREAISAEKITWPVISDAECATGLAYGFNSIPELILFAPDGTILARDFYSNQLEDILSENIQ